jgi:hypothetical protein
MVKDAQAKVRHADLVGVRKEKADPGPYGRVVLVHGIDFGIDVPRGFGDQREKVLVHETPIKMGSRVK